MSHKSGGFFMFFVKEVKKKDEFPCTIWFVIFYEYKYKKFD